MAHRTDIVQVQKNFPKSESGEVLTDPNCGRSLTHKEARSILFRKSETLYFCSKKCREEYLMPKTELKKAA